jgi:hypothetical protein
MSAKEDAEVLAGVVRDGKVVLKDSRLPEGTRVTVKVLETDDDSDTFEVTPEEKAELLTSIAEAERGEGVDAYDRLRQLREGASSSNVG